MSRGSAVERGDADGLVGHQLVRRRDVERVAARHLRGEVLEPDQRVERLDRVVGPADHAGACLHQSRPVVGPLEAFVAECDRTAQAIARGEARLDARRDALVGEAVDDRGRQHLGVLDPRSVGQRRLAVAVEDHLVGVEHGDHGAVPDGVGRDRPAFLGQRCRRPRQGQRLPEQHTVVDGVHVVERRAQRAGARTDPSVGVELDAFDLDVGVAGLVPHALGGEPTGDEDAHAARQAICLASAQQRVQVLPVVHPGLGDLTQTNLGGFGEPGHQLRVETLVQRVTDRRHRIQPARLETAVIRRDGVRIAKVVRRLDRAR